MHTLSLMCTINCFIYNADFKRHSFLLFYFIISFHSCLHGLIKNISVLSTFLLLSMTALLKKNIRQRTNFLQNIRLNLHCSKNTYSFRAPECSFVRPLDSYANPSYRPPLWSSFEKREIVVTWHFVTVIHFLCGILTLNSFKLPLNPTTERWKDVWEGQRTSLLRRINRFQQRIRHELDWGGDFHFVSPGVSLNSLCRTLQIHVNATLKIRRIRRGEEKVPILDQYGFIL